MHPDNTILWYYLNRERNIQRDTAANFEKKRLILVDQ
jgi:hypothetical protein